MPETYLETAIVITVPETKTQVLVRLPGHLNPKDVAVDFRPTPGDTWTPSEFFTNSVVVNHQ